MKPSSISRAALAGSLALTLIGCTAASHQAQTAAGEQAGRAAAGVTLERQPDECGQPFARLPYGAGDEAIAVIRRYDAYVLGPINERVARCYRFNEDQRLGLEG